MNRVRVSGLAEQDLDDIWYEIAKRSGSMEIANGVVDSITDIFPLFGSTPEAGRRPRRYRAGHSNFPR